MNASQLEPLVRSLEAQVENLKESLSEIKKSQDKHLDLILKHQSQLDKTQQQIADHIAHVEKWDARRWAIIGAIVGGLAINIVMLFLNRK